VGEKSQLSARLELIRKHRKKGKITGVPAQRKQKTRAQNGPNFDLGKDRGKIRGARKRDQHQKNGGEVKRGDRRHSRKSPSSGGMANKRLGGKMTTVSQNKNLEKGSASIPP